VPEPGGGEFVTIEWVDWFNHKRLLQPIGYLPPAEFEARTISGPRWPDSHNSLSDVAGTVHNPDTPPGVETWADALIAGCPASAIVDTAPAADDGTPTARSRALRGARLPRLPDRARLRSWRLLTEILTR
jgi:hypothetical protein